MRFVIFPNITLTLLDTYCLPPSCRQIFTDTVPFAHLNDVVFILELFVKRAKLTRPVNSDERGLTTQLWSLLEECWEFEPRLRPTMRDVLSLIQDKEALKERERIRMFPSLQDREVAIHLSQDTFRALLASSWNYDLTGRIKYDDRQPESYGRHSATFIGYYTEEVSSSIASKTKLAVRKIHGRFPSGVDYDFTTVRCSCFGYNCMKTKVYPNFVQRFSEELRIWSKLNHPHILPLIGYTLQADGYPCLISEWMENGPALKYLKQCSSYDVLSVVSYKFVPLQILTDNPSKSPRRL